MFSRTQHLISNVRYEFHSEAQCTVKAYLYNPMMFRFITFPGVPSFICGGEYIMELTRSGNTWRIVTLTQDMMYNTVHFAILQLLAMLLICGTTIWRFA